MIVRRLLAMYAIGPNVSEQIAMQLRNGKLEQAFAVQLWQRQSADEQCVKLERAVIAFGGQIAA